MSTINKKNTVSEHIADIPEDISERTVVTSIKRMEAPIDERAYILFISGPLIGKMYLIENEKTIIGRSQDSNIAINDSRISRHHICIHYSFGQVAIEDLNSTNGTFVNGERIRRRILESGDKVHISSDTFFKFAVGDAAERMFQEEMHQMANYDAVTGILNKHAFVRRLHEEYCYASRNNISISLLMMDIDFFKKINDTYGHMAGDYVLAGVAKRISEIVRDEDILARYGGEEFAVILRNIDQSGASLLATRICESISKLPFKFEDQNIPATISIGIASTPHQNITSEEDFITIADHFLYESKKNGRNQVSG